MARDAVHDLTALLADAAVRSRAAVALVRIDPGQADKVVPILIEQLKAPDDARRHEALLALANLGPAAKAAAPALAEQLKDIELGGAAFMALSEMGPAAIPVLVGLLKDPNPEYRRKALVVLYRFGPDAREALGPVLAALTDSDTEVRSRAAETIEAIGPEARDAVPYLVANLLAWQSEVRATSALALGHLGPAAKEARLPLRECLMDPEKDVRYAAALALGRIDPKSVESVPALRDALDDPYPGVQLAAIDSLTRIDRTHTKDVRTDPRRPEPAAAVSGHALPGRGGTHRVGPGGGPSGRTHAGRRAEWRERRRPPQCLDAAGAHRAGADVAGRARPGGCPPRPRPEHARDDRSGVGNLGPKAREAVPVLLPLLQDNVAAVRKEAANALRSIDPRTAKRYGL